MITEDVKTTATSKDGNETYDLNEVPPDGRPLPLNSPYPLGSPLWVWLCCATNRNHPIYDPEFDREFREETDYFTVPIN